MHRREMSPIYRIAPCRWLSVIALLLSLPVLLAGQVGSFGGSLQSDNTYGPAVAADGSGGSTHKALPPAPEQMGDLLEREGHYQAAIEAYAQVLTPSAVVWNKLGICYQLLYDLKDAEHSYKESLKLLPANPIVLNDLAIVQELKQDFPSAERMYRKALEIDPRNAQILKNLGTNLLMQGEYTKGAEAYKQALAINQHILDFRTGPKVNETGSVQSLSAANYIKARSCAEAGMTDCAIDYLQRALIEGSATVKQVNADADFANLRGTPALARLIGDQK